MTVFQHCIVTDTERSNSITSCDPKVYIFESGMAEGKLMGAVYMNAFIPGITISNLQNITTFIKCILEHPVSNIFENRPPPL